MGTFWYGLFGFFLWFLVIGLRRCREGFLTLAGSVLAESNVFFLFLVLCLCRSDDLTWLLFAMMSMKPKNGGEISSKTLEGRSWTFRMVWKRGHGNGSGVFPEIAINLFASSTVTLSRYYLILPRWPWRGADPGTERRDQQTLQRKKTLGEEN